MRVKHKTKVERVGPNRARGTPVDHVPAPDMGTDIIRKERYTSEAFMEMEWQNIWSKVWLLGGLERDIPKPGDYICTDIGRESVLIVRQKDGGVKAFFNVCLHRANRIALEEGVGTTEDNEFRCRYHDWAYALDGKLTHIPDFETFPQGAPCKGLKEIPCDTWGSFVWFSLNENAEPLAEYLEELPKHLDPYHFDRMTMTRDITVEWDCNWKTAVDAFNESYHVQGTHKQLLYYLHDLDIQIDCYGKHNRYLIPFGCLSPRIDVPPEISPPLKVMMLDAGLDPASYEGGMNDIRQAVQNVKRAQGAEQGKDYSDLNDDQLTDDYNYLVFPNVTLNTHADDLMLFRHRPHPTDPNKMFFDIWMFDYQAEDEDELPRPRHMHYKHGEKSLGMVIDQDAANLPLVQQGMHSAGYQGLWLGDQEIRLRHFHKTITDYIYGPEGKKESDL